MEAIGTLIRSERGRFDERRPLQSGDRPEERPRPDVSVSSADLINEPHDGLRPIGEDDEDPQCDLAEAAEAGAGHRISPS